MDQPKVSVSLITYNHARFIAQAIEGVLAQRTNFSFELIIGEDGSSDGTREIVQRYAAEHPSVVRLYLRSRENLIYYRGQPTGRRNFIDNLNSAQGEYVAMLDGDDYWTDPEKLQRQVDLLEANPDCSTCFHPVAMVDEESRELPELAEPPATQSRYTVVDLIGRRFFANTASVVYRRSMFPGFPAWFEESPVGDFPLHVLNGIHGDFLHLDRRMAAYRIHDGGRWSTRGGEATSATPERIARDRRKVRQLEGVIHLYELLEQHLGSGDRRRPLREGLAFYRHELAHVQRRLEDWPGLRETIWKVIDGRPWPADVPPLSVAALTLQAYFPPLARWTDALRRNQH